MEKYKDLGGNSGVATYALAIDGITVEFNDGHAYLYNYASAGGDNY